MRIAFQCILVCKVTVYGCGRGTDMFGLGMTEIMVVLIIALIVFGPKKLPEIGRGLGKAIREFKTAGSEITRTLNAEPPPQLPQQEQPPPPKPPEN